MRLILLLFAFFSLGALGATTQIALDPHDKCSLQTEAQADVVRGGLSERKLRHDEDPDNPVRPDQMPEFDRLWSTQTSRYLKKALSILRNYHDAEEVIQDAGFKIARKWNNFREEAARPTWIMRTVINKSLDLYDKNQRRNSREKSVEDFLVENDDGGTEKIADRRWNDFFKSHAKNPYEIFFEKELRLWVMAAIRELPEVYQEIVILRGLYEFDDEEIAKVMELSPHTVKSKYYFARNLLKQKLEATKGTKGPV